MVLPSVVLRLWGVEARHLRTEDARPSDVGTQAITIRGVLMNAIAKQSKSDHELAGLTLHGHGLVLTVIWSRSAALASNLGKVFSEDGLDANRRNRGRGLTTDGARQQLHRISRLDTWVLVDDGSHRPGDEKSPRMDGELHGR